MDAQATLDRWLEHLTAADLDLLRGSAAAAGVPPDTLTTDPAALERVLADRATFDALFAAPGDGPVLPASPFLTFAVVVHRGRAELEGATYVQEWVGARQRLPVLGGDDIREFLDGPQRRLYLTELLASYTRVASGTTWVRTARGWQRSRFSELDPVRMAALLEAVPVHERAGILRRLGDLAMFLTGVFPDHVERGLGDLATARLLRLSGITDGDDELAGVGGVGLLEHLGIRWYRAAVRSAPVPTRGLEVVADVGERFAVARRALNHLTDRYLFPYRAGWFGNPV